MGTSLSSTESAEQSQAASTGIESTCGESASETFRTVCQASSGGGLLAVMVLILVIVLCCWLKTWLGASNGDWQVLQIQSRRGHYITVKINRRTGVTYWLTSSRNWEQIGNHKYSAMTDSQLDQHIRELQNEAKKASCDYERCTQNLDRTDDGEVDAEKLSDEKLIELRDKLKRKLDIWAEIENAEEEQKTRREW